MPEARERSSSRVSALAERLSPAAYAISAAVVVVGAIAGFGGLETVADEPVARADAGQEIPGKQLHVAIEDAWLADGFDPFFEPESGQRYLAVRARVTNVSDTPVTTVRDNVLVDGLTGSEGEPQADEAIRIGESSTNPVLQPGVAEQIVLLWQVDSTDWSAGSTITVHVLDKTLREGFLFDASWSDPVVTAQVPLVIGDRGFDDMTRDVDEIDESSEVAP